MEQHERLRQYNRWRRGDKRMKAPNPKELGELIDGVADRLEVLEREHQEFFERWRGERRKREALAEAVNRCHRMLLTEPDTKGALFKAENILREALADSKLPHNGRVEGRDAASSRRVPSHDGLCGNGSEVGAGGTASE